MTWKGENVSRAAGSVPAFTSDV
ncbi:hypothetical protein CCACVL1_18297 [Corchorus capsularis]|uniref:Uncharacterized protein n=1 Tax=Corchorus capsularis TaxID=210143 RepID=A0A1R3HLX6_COCAP|nr:hypothetical protein CCACVL1_18297 [Corchorus capsularis]